MPEDHMPPQRRVTIHQVAARAGVSISAVSKVLRQAYGVSPSLRARVEAAIDELGYRPLASARGLRGNTFTVGLALPDIRNPFFAEILNGMTLEAGGANYQCILSVGEAAGDDERAVVSLIDRQVDGVVFLGATMKEPAVERLAKRIPIVAIGYHAPRATLFDTVNGDDVEGARIAIRHLVDQGFSRISMISLEGQKSNIVAQRELGYRLEMMERGLGRFVNIHRDSHTSATKRFLRSLVDARQEPAAVLCWCDTRALEILGAARELGVDVPNMLGVVGYDNSVPAALAQNDLSSVVQSGSDIGRNAARLLVERINGRLEANHALVATDLVARGTTRPSVLAN